MRLAVDQAPSAVAHFAVAAAVILKEDQDVHLDRTGQRDLMFFQIRLVFGRVKLDTHGVYIRYTRHNSSLLYIRPPCRLINVKVAVPLRP